MLINGESLSVGIGSGKTYHLKEKDKIIEAKKIDKNEVEKEYNDLLFAISKADLSLNDLKDADELVSIYRLIINDKLILDEVYKMMKSELLNAEYCYKKILDDCVNKFLANEYMSLRKYDIMNCFFLVVNNLNNRYLDDVKEDVILCTEILSPSLLYEENAKHIKGVITNKNAYASHFCIILRAKKIPVIFVPDFTDVLGKYLYIDGELGIISDEIIERTVRNDQYCDLNNCINLYGIINNIEELDEVDGVKGIGLVRTEFIKDEDYEKLLTYSRPINIRTFDFSNDKEDLKRDVSLNKQIANIFKYYNKDNLSITIPMVKNALELKKIKTILNKYNNFKLGAMIETKSAILNLKEIINEVDFIEVGTNDLLSSYLNTKRDETDFSCSFEPEFILLLKSIVDEANKNKKLCLICGEYASSFLALPLLMGLGYRDFVINNAMINKYSCSNYDLTYCQKIADTVVKLKNKEEVIDYLRQIMSEKK